MIIRENKIAGHDRFDCGVDTVEIVHSHFKCVDCELEYYSVTDWEADETETFTMDEYRYAVEYYNERVPDHAAIPLF